MKTKDKHKLLRELIRLLLFQIGERENLIPHKLYFVKTIPTNKYPKGCPIKSPKTIGRTFEVVGKNKKTGKIKKLYYEIYITKLLIECFDYFEFIRHKMYIGYDDFIHPFMLLMHELAHTKYLNHHTKNFKDFEIYLFHKYYNSYMSMKREYYFTIGERDRLTFEEIKTKIKNKKKKTK